MLRRAVALAVLFPAFVAAHVQTVQLRPVSLSPGAVVAAALSHAGPSPAAGLSWAQALPPAPSALQPRAFAPALGLEPAPAAAIGEPGREGWPALARRLEGIERDVQSASRDGWPAAARELERVYQGGARADAGFVLNDEGVPVAGKAADYYARVRALARKIAARYDPSESMDVMDDAYGDVWTKLKAIEALAGKRRVALHNTHLPGTLTWVDAVLDEGRRRTAIQAYRVYFHKAPNPDSEVEEGIRRVSFAINDALWHFRAGGPAEAELGRLDEIVLAFHSRGHARIKAYLKERESEVRAQTGGRVRFAYLEDMVQTPASPEALRKELGALSRKYQGRGLDKIAEGVVYSRYVGLLLELRTIETLLDAGHQIIHSGREIFDARGMYSTELDVVSRAPDGKVSIVEAKSARVGLPPEKVLRSKVVNKLERYRRDWALLKQAAGGRLDGVVFAMDPGRNRPLIPFLRGREAELSARYGFPVRFLFIDSVPRGRQ
ncbi:MAG: hypothetical protein HY554_02515 [Elusimicrobia bacterium]|nr:hypothetical protein [Elusimicrobiota bacterium]